MISASLPASLIPEAQGLARIVFGLLLVRHGLEQVFGYPPVLVDYPLFSLRGALKFLTLPGGILVMLGLFTRCAAFVCSGMMAVAYWQFHVFGGQAQGIGKFLPGVNQGIPAALLCFVFLYIACKGAGPWSVDAKREAAKAGT